MDFYWNTIKAEFEVEVQRILWKQVTYFVARNVVSGTMN